MFPRLKKGISDLYLAHFDKVLPHRFRFADVPYAELPEYPFTLTDIYEARTDGLVIRKVLSEDEVGRILHGFRDNREEMYRIRFGNTFGETLSDSTDDRYFEQAERFYRRYRDMIGEDIYDRIDGVFETLSGGLPAQVAKDASGRVFVPATIRALTPGAGGLPIHCENATTTDIDPISDPLRKVFCGQNILSYFVVLQNTEKGGSLILFNDIDYHKGEGLKSLSQLAFVKGQRIKPEPGDMLIFNGGTIWHKVEEIRGKKERITLAGFLDLNPARSEWLYWS